MRVPDSVVIKIQPGLSSHRLDYVLSNRPAPDWMEPEVFLHTNPPQPQLCVLLSVDVADCAIPVWLVFQLDLRAGPLCNRLAFLH